MFCQNGCMDRAGFGIEAALNLSDYVTKKFGHLQN